MANTGMNAVGVTAIGAGALFIYSAFTKKALFGKNGMIREFLTTGSVEDAGKAVGTILGDVSGIATNLSYGNPSAVETRRPLNNKPPGA